MIKRRFYKQEHGDKDAPSDSSSSSGSEVDAEASVDSDAEEDDNNVVMESRKKDQPCSSSSGYESEDSSANEVNLDSSGSPTNDNVSGDENYKQDFNGTHVSAEKLFNSVIKQNTVAVNGAMTNDILDCVLKCKSVFKCKLCPRIVCLTEETLKAHLKSKRHAWSGKLLREGRLKMMVNSDGEIEGDGETHHERHVSTLALAESNKNTTLKSKKNKGRQRQRKRLKKVAHTIIMPRKPTRRAHLQKPQPAFSRLARSIALVNSAHKVKQQVKQQNANFTVHRKVPLNSTGSRKLNLDTTESRSEESHSSCDDEDSSSEDSFEGVVQADFAFFDPKPDDFHGVKVLLQTYLDNKEWDLSSFVDLILKQTTVGTVVKIEEDEDNGVYGFVSAINLQRYKDCKCMMELKEFLLKMCEDKEIKNELRYI